MGQVDFSGFEIIEKNFPIFTGYVGSSGGGAGTFLMEHNPKSSRGVGGCFLKFSKSIMVLFLSQKKRRGTPKHDYKSTWYFFITKMLEFATNLR